jgi:hypothetical protein
MDKTAIKNFSIWARNKLIRDVADKAALVGVTEKGIVTKEPSSTADVEYYNIGTREPYSIRGEEITQRRSLETTLKKREDSSDYKTAYNSIIEEVAYTWFNRLIAIRFMEANGFLPSGVKVLCGDDGRAEPEIVARPFDSKIFFSDSERDRIQSMKSENKQDELFRFLFIRQCNDLNKILPGLFEKTNDYTELLLNISYTDRTGVVPKLISDIPESNFTEAVEIVGWMYQYYNTEPKNETFDLLGKNVKVTKERIPAATQLFTPDWIVRYMVENSLGRLWLEGHPNDDLKAEWKYYLDEAEQTPEVKEQLKTIRAGRKGSSPEDITFIDPCMGSGHILVYAFEVLMQIYESAGYVQKDAVKSILEKNLFGLDIDKRAYQLAYFALMMCARKYDKRFFESGISPQVYHPQGYREGENYGSLIRIDKNMIGKPEQQKSDITSYTEYQVDLRIWNFKQLLSRKYDVVCTNPPYMGSSGMNPALSDFVKRNYPDSKSDLFAAFIERCGSMLNSNGYQAMITQHAWMFLSSYEKLRGKLLTRDIVNMAHLGARAFEEIGGEVVQTTAFVMSALKEQGFLGTYARLVDFGSQNEKETAFLSGEHRHTTSIDSFAKIPGSPVAYWVGENTYDLFASEKALERYVECRSGIMTGSDDFVKLWFELNIEKIKFDCKTAEDMGDFKWFPLNSGGDYRNWYGNNIKVVDLWNDGFNIRNTVPNYRLRDKAFYFKRGITWGRITSSQIAFREVIDGSLFGDAGPIAFVESNRHYILGFLCSVVVNYLLNATNPTLNFQVRDIMGIPLKIDSDKQSEIVVMVQNNIVLSRADWDTFETSWDFDNHPLIDANLPQAPKLYASAERQRLTREGKEIPNWTTHPKYGVEYFEGEGTADTTIEGAFKIWEKYASERFDTLKANEEELNRIFIDIYGLQDELTPEVEDKDVTVRRADLGREIRSLISYAVGCMFGRYSLDNEGLIYAGGQWDPSKYERFIPDSDNIIPITDEKYLKDDIVGRFVEFVRTVYGDATLEENLNFIANALETKGSTSREIIRNYFIRDFYKDHLKIYQKRPIYWLFDSGKENGFKALIYIHRYNQDIVGKLRVDYLHRLQQIYEGEIVRMRQIIDTSDNSKDVNDARKCLDKLSKQQDETKNYDSKIGHLAVARIELDLDDGVKANYEKLQTADGKKYEILGKI